MHRRAFVIAGTAAGFATAAFARGAPPSDDWITDQIRMRLAGDAVVKGGALGVTVRDGVVTLTGVVDMPKARNRAELLAKRVRGVKAVINRITIASR